MSNKRLISEAKDVINSGDFMKAAWLLRRMNGPTSKCPRRTCEYCSTVRELRDFVRKGHEDE